MAIQTSVVDKFRGLNLGDGIDVGMDYAVDSVNTDHNINGAIQSRGGWFQSSTVGAGTPTKFLVNRALTNRIVTIGAGEINQYTRTTGVKNVPAGAPTWAASTVSPPAMFGLPTGERYVYVPTTNFGVGVQFRRLEDNPLPNTVTVGILAAKPQFMATYPGQNRMAYVGFYAAADAPGGANGGPSVVFFSDEQAPESVPATNFVVLEPGDGGQFAGAVGWQNQLFIFKNRTVYVFYGVSPDDDGKPLFDYHAYPLPDPIPETGGNVGIVPIAAGPDGVYFIGSQGLWKTTGGAPTRIPTTVDAFFSGEGDTVGNLFTYRQQTRGNVVMGWVGDRLFINYLTASSATPRTMVWNKTSNVWTSWEVNGDTMTAVPITTNEALFTGGTSAGSQHLWKQFSGAADPSNPVAWRYKSGYADLGFPGEKRMRFTDIYGQGVITPTISAKGRRVATTVGITAASTTVGATDVTDRKRFLTGIKGRLFQFSVDNNVTVKSIIERVELKFSEGSSV